MRNDVKERVVEKIQNLASEPRPAEVVKLKGSDNEYRIRVGDYRVRYEVDDDSQLVQILQCKHRKDVYICSRVRLKFMLKSVERIYKNGANELSEVPSDISESPVIVTFLSVQPVKVTPQNMYFGMLSTSNQQSTEEDFK